MDINRMFGGSKTPLTKENINENQHYLRFSGKRIFEHGITLMQNAIEDVLNKSNITFDDIDFIVPHQANKRMIEVLAQRLALPIEKFIVNIVVLKLQA